MAALAKITQTGRVVVFGEDVPNWIVMTMDGAEAWSSDGCTVPQESEAFDAICGPDDRIILGWSRARWATAKSFFEDHGQTIN